MVVDKRDMAINFIHNKLNDREKIRVYQLLIADPDFKQILHEEFMLYTAMLKFRKTLDSSEKDRILENILKEIGKSAQKQNKSIKIGDIIDYALEYTLSPFFSNLIRRILLDCNLSYNITK